MRNNSNTLVTQYKARCRTLFSRVGFLAWKELPRESCWLSRSTRDLERIEEEKREARERENHGRHDDQKPDRPTTVSDDSLLRDILQGRIKRIFITGEGGIGKTEFARHLAWKLSDPSSRIAPLLFELSQWKDTDDIYKLAAGPDADTLEPLAQDGRVAFIFDGLDELGFKFAAFVRNFQHLVIRFPACVFILAGRPGSLGDLQKHYFTKEVQHLLEPLRPLDIERYIRGYFKGATKSTRGAKLIAAIRSTGQVMNPLLGQPFMLAMTCWSWEDDKTDVVSLLNDPSALVENGLRNIFARRSEDDVGNLTGPLKLSEEACLTSLSAIAAHSFGSSYEIDRQKAIQVLQKHAGARSPGFAAKRLAKLASHCGVLIRTEDRNYYRFTNRVMAEFLAARWIVSHGHPENHRASLLQPGENPIDRSILDFLSDYIWSIRHRDLIHAINFELARRKLRLLARFINWLAATLQHYVDEPHYADEPLTLFSRFCRALHAALSPSISPTLLLQLQAELQRFVLPDEDWHRYKWLSYCVSLLPNPLRTPYLAPLIRRLRACDDPKKHLEAIENIAYALVVGFANDPEVRTALLDALRACNDHKEHGEAIHGIADALASGFANDPEVRTALLEALLACDDPKEHEDAIDGIVKALGSGFANDPKVRDALLEALRACKDPKDHGKCIRSIAGALGANWANDRSVRKALLEALRICNDPKEHWETIREIVRVLGSCFANDVDVRDVLLKALRECDDFKEHGLAIWGIAQALQSGFANDSNGRHALLLVLRACKDPKKHGVAICGIAEALALGFANLEVLKVLLEALRACDDLKEHEDTIRGIAGALESGFAKDSDVRKALLKVLRACDDPKEYGWVISGIAEVLGSGFANSDVRKALFEALRTCKEAVEHGEAIHGIVRGLGVGFPGDLDVRKRLIEALRACKDPKEHCQEICSIALALESGFANDPDARKALLEALRACDDSNEHWYASWGITQALKSGFVGNSDVARALCKREEFSILTLTTWNDFVVLLGPRPWLSNWAGEFGEKWGLAGDPAFAIKDLDDSRPEGASDAEWANRKAVLVAPREKIRHGLDPRLLPPILQEQQSSTDISENKVVPILNGAEADTSANQEVSEQHELLPTLNALEYDMLRALGLLSLKWVAWCQKARVARQIGRPPKFAKERLMQLGLVEMDPDNPRAFRSTSVGRRWLAHQKTAG